MTRQHMLFIVRLWTFQLINVLFVLFYIVFNIFFFYICDYFFIMILKRAHRIGTRPDTRYTSSWLSFSLSLCFQCFNFTFRALHESIIAHLSSFLTRLWQNISNFKSLMSSGIMACVYLHYHPSPSSSCLRRRVRENPQIPNVIELIDSLNSNEDATQQLHSLRTHLDVNEITFFKPNWKLRAAATGNSSKTLTFN